MRFWIVLWSLAISFFTLQTYAAYKNGNDYVVLFAAGIILAIYMWLYTFVRIIIVDFVPIIIEFCKIGPKILQNKEKEKNGEQE